MSPLSSDPAAQGNYSKALSVVMRYRYSLRTGAPKSIMFWTKATVIQRLGTHPRLQLPGLFRQQVVPRWTRDKGKLDMDLALEYTFKLEASLLVRPVVHMFR